MERARALSILTSFADIDALWEPEENEAFASESFAADVVRNATGFRRWPDGAAAVAFARDRFIPRRQDQLQRNEGLSQTQQPRAMFYCCITTQQLTF